MAFGGLVEDSESRIPIFGRGLVPRWNYTNDVSGGCPLDVIAWTDTIPVGDCLRDGDLVLRCYLGHFESSIPILDSSKERILVQYSAPAII